MKKGTQEDVSWMLDAIKGQTARPKPASRPLRILVVDDEEPVRKFVDRVLKDAGFETLTAGGGAEAIEIAAGMQQPLDLLVTDVMMPQMTGNELARRLRQDERSLKVLYLTGYSDQLFKDKVTLWQDEAFLDKPCSVKGLLQAISQLFVGSPDLPA